MRNATIPILVVLLLAALGAAAWQTLQLEQHRTQLGSLELEEQQTRDRYSRAIDEIAAIQDSLAAILLGDDGQLRERGLSGEQQLSETRGDAALARISEVKAGIERAKHRIEDLDRRLQKSGVRVAGLERMIAGLKRDVAEKETQVAALTETVQTLETRVTGLVAEAETRQAELRDRDQALEARRRELGTVYYAIGTRRQLTEAGVTEARGGLLGLGRTLEATGRIAPEWFTALDTDVKTELRIPSAKVQVVSDQPPSSYALEVVGGETVLRILDAARFRTVKHLIIVTA